MNSNRNGHAPGRPGTLPDVAAQRYRVTLLDCNPSPWLAEVTFIRTNRTACLSRDHFV